jgi:hypothetical protein
MTEANEIVLGTGQTAEPKTCGSCHFFGRSSIEDPYNHGGYCKMELPPQYQHRIQGEGEPTSWINDTGSCDLWRSSGKTFVVSRRIKP